MIEELGDKLKKLRKRKGESLREAAGNIGMNHSYLHSLEKGESKNPTKDTLNKLANYYNVSENYLLLDKNDWYDELPLQLKEFVKKENIEYLNLSLKLKESNLNPRQVEELIKTLNKIKDE